MDRQSPHARARALRRLAAEIIFAWGSVVSALWYAALTVLGRPPLLDDHITVTGIAMLTCWLISRFVLDFWRQRAEVRRRS